MGMLLQRHRKQQAQAKKQQQNVDTLAAKIQGKPSKQEKPAQKAVSKTVKDK